MKITLNHDNGSTWNPSKKAIAGHDCFVLSNKNKLAHLDNVGERLKGNLERFEIYVVDWRSVLNALQAGLSIRMSGVGNDGSNQNNLFVGERILFDGNHLAAVLPPKT